MTHAADSSSKSPGPTCPNCSFPLIVFPEPKETGLEFTTSYEIPRPEEVQKIMEMIAADEAAAGDIRASLSRLERIQKKLSEQEAIYTWRAEARKTALSTWRKLPNELLGDIFLLCLDKGRRILQEQSITTPWTFGQVCGRWREVARSNTFLWRNMLDLKVECKPGWRKNRLPVVTSIIRCSGTLPPLKLTLNIPHVRIRPTHPVIDALLPHFQRVRDLTLNLSGRNREVLSGMAGKLPSLATLRLSIHGEGNRNPSLTLPFLPTFEDCPLLQDVGVANYSGFCVTAWLVLPWGNLRRFIVSGLHILPDTLTVLEHVDSLEQMDCVSKPSEPPFGGADTAMMLKHDRLQHLNLKLGERLWPPYIFSSLVRKITLPNLLSFSLDTSDDATESGELLQSFFLRSNCQLTCLDIGALDISDTDLTIFLGGLASLHELHILWSFQLFPFLSAPTGTHFHFLLPGLKRLFVSLTSLAAAREIDNNFDEIARFIEMRGPANRAQGLVEPLEMLALECQGLAIAQHIQFRLGWDGHNLESESVEISAWVKDTFKTLEWDEGKSTVPKNWDEYEYELVELMTKLTRSAAWYDNFHPHPVHTSDALSVAHRLYDRLPPDTRTNAMSDLLRRWDHAVPQYLHSFGWMSPSTPLHYFKGTIYAERQGSIYLDMPPHPALQRIYEQRTRL